MQPKKSRMSDFDIHTLVAWYEHLAKDEASQLVVIFQDFESFDTTSLTFSALCLLRTEKFKLQEANECVNALVDQLFISGDYGFQLGLAPFNLILDRFTLHNLSVDSVVNTLHANSQLEMAAEWLTDDHADWIRMQPSFQKHVETLASLPAEATRLLEDDAYLLKICVPDWIRELRLHRVKTAIAFHTLLALQSQLPALPNKRRELRVMHMFALREDMGDSPLVVQTCQAVRHVNSAELRNILLDIQDLFNNSDVHKDELQCIDAFLATLDTVEERFRALFKHTKRDVSDMFIESAWEKMSRTTQKSSSSVVVLRADTKPAVVDYANLVKEAFTPQLRATIQTALRLPVHYLGCACCKDKSASILPSQPDTCILYQLYLECGEDADKHDEQSEKAMTLRARFAQSVAELQFLGMIKPTQRKTDHVERLNWGTG
ncbi:hypothetical protein SYNPS1DRAFT_24313 [Syncephalis pseudoplumigaleata]|uniref:Origin recognition complex subunit 3 n=1 Tax=Syncephalis pseudoplumigaleata TaxID=1712513 RepID=A0A4P9YUH8_9FUNG|nr:hypothetical protein SYNPS1DRAFT_24313 [Syncephalis pseudoplumigaleata]|eukprot:RKP23617.1 hypothetical protein SYNPS1DRAFT_24313 [Syncephalis pseudoplumigaleata]